MTRLAAFALALLALSGCVPDAPDVVDGYDLDRAYQRCIGYGDDDELIANRIACTQAVYGGRP